MAPKVIKKPTVIESVTPEKAAVVSKKPKTSTITSTKSVAESHLRTEMYDDNLKAIYDDKNLTVKFVKVNEEEDKSTKKITPPKAKKTPK